MTTIEKKKSKLNSFKHQGLLDKIKKNKKKEFRKVFEMCICGQIWFYFEHKNSWGKYDPPPPVQLGLRSIFTNGYKIFSFSNFSTKFIESV